MSTLTYSKGLPTPFDELNNLGVTDFEAFLSAYSAVFHKAGCETVNHLLSTDNFNKSQWNTHLQWNYAINKRHANGIISFAKATVNSAQECRNNYIKTLEGKLKSIKKWIEKNENKLKDARIFYSKKNWIKSKTVCKFPIYCSIQSKGTNWQHLRFKLHHKKRLVNKLNKQIEHLKSKPIQVKVPRNHCFIVGSKSESFGNQVCQWDGEYITFRVPYCLESRFGTHVKTRIGNFNRNINRLPVGGSRTWYFYRKNQKWNAAVQFTPGEIAQVSRHSGYGCIGIDLNPGSIGWAYSDYQGNLKAHGQIALQQGLPKGKQDAQLVDACLQLASLADTYSSPIAVEQLDFSTKKESLNELGNKYARMLSSWAYSRFFQLLNSINSNRGIKVLTVNPAYSSLIGLVKYARQYGLASDESAAFVIARRAERLTEKIPHPINAYLDVKPGKHVWGAWNQLNKKLKART